MSVDVKEKELTFDLIKVLNVCENDPDLDEIFRNEAVTQPYNMLYTLATQNAMPEEMVDRANGIYKHIILKNQKPRMAYAKLFRDGDEPVPAGPTEGPIEPIAPIAPQLEVASETVEKKPKYKLPKHYGKQQILKDIEASNQTTELDRAMIALNGYRNVYSKLKNRCISDKLKGTSKLTDADCRDIVAVLRLMENKLANILKK